MSETWRPRRKHRPFPYFKVQVLDDLTLSWKDVQRAFSTENEARAYIADKLTSTNARVMLVEASGRSVIEPAG